MKLSGIRIIDLEYPAVYSIIDRLDSLEIDRIPSPFIHPPSLHQFPEKSPAPTDFTVPFLHTILGCRAGGGGLPKASSLSMP